MMMCITRCWRIELHILISCPLFHLLFARVLSCVSQYRFNCTLLSFHFANVSPSSGCKPRLMIKGGIKNQIPCRMTPLKGIMELLDGTLSGEGRSQLREGNKRASLLDSPSLDQGADFEKGSHTLPCLSFFTYLFAYLYLVWGDEIT